MVNPIPAGPAPFLPSFPFEKANVNGEVDTPPLLPFILFKSPDLYPFCSVSYIAELQESVC